MRFAQKLNELYYRDKARGADINDRHLAEAVSASVPSRERVGKSLVNQWRRGQGASPRLSHVLALAEYFRVPVAYLVCDEFEEPRDAERAMNCCRAADTSRTVIAGEESPSARPKRHGNR